MFSLLWNAIDGLHEELGAWPGYQGVYHESSGQKYVVVSAAGVLYRYDIQHEDDDTLELINQQKVQVVHVEARGTDNVVVFLDSDGKYHAMRVADTDEITSIELQQNHRMQNGISTTVTRNADGRYHYTLVSATPMLNRSRAVDSMALFDSFLAFQRETGIMPKLDFFHWREGCVIGDAYHCQRLGPVYVEMGWFRDDDVSQRMAEKLAADSTGYWGTSIDFRSSDQERIEVGDGVYADLFTTGQHRYTAILPQSAASHSLTMAIASKEVTRMKDLPQDQLDEFMAVADGLDQSVIDGVIGRATTVNEMIESGEVVFRAEVVSEQDDSDASEVEEEVTEEEVEESATEDTPEAEEEEGTSQDGDGAASGTGEEGSEAEVETEESEEDNAPATLEIDEEPATESEEEPAEEVEEVEEEAEPATEDPAPRSATGQPASQPEPFGLAAMREEFANFRLSIQSQLDELQTTVRALPSKSKIVTQSALNEVRTAVNNHAEHIEALTLDVEQLDAETRSTSVMGYAKRATRPSDFAKANKEIEAVRAKNKEDGGEPVPAKKPGNTAQVIMERRRKQREKRKNKGKAKTV